MISYKDSIIILNNLSAVVNQTIVKEAAFLSKEKIEKNKKQKAEEAKRFNDLEGVGAADAAKFVRNLGNINQEKEKLLDQLYKLQQQLTALTHSNKGLAKLEDEQEQLSESLERDTIKLDKLSNSPIVNENIQKQQQLELELANKQSSIKDESDKLYQIQTFLELEKKVKSPITPAYKEKIKEFKAKISDREMVGETVDRKELNDYIIKIKDEEASGYESSKKQIEEHISTLKGEEKETQKQLDKVKDDLGDYTFTSINVRSKKSRLKEIEQALSKLHTELHDGEFVGKLEEQIDEIKTKLAELGVEESDYKKIKSDPSEPHDIEDWNHTIEEARNSMESSYLTTLQMDHLQEAADLGEGNPKIPYIISNHLLESKQNLTTQLLDVNDDIDQQLGIFANKGSSLTDIQQKILVMMGNIRSYDEEIATYNTIKNKSQKDIDTLKNLRVLREKAISDLNATATQMPELKELFSKKLKLQNMIKPLNRTIEQEKLIREQVLYGDKTEVFDLLEDYYSNNRSYFYNAIAQEVAKYVENQIVN